MSDIEKNSEEVSLRCKSNSIASHKLMNELDEQILSVLDDPDICKPKPSGNLGSNFPDDASGDSKGESDDDDYDDDDDVRASMGYVPLPQHSDEEYEDDDDDGGSDLHTETAPINSKETFQPDTRFTSCQSCNKESDVTPSAAAAAPKLEIKAVEEIKQAMSGFFIPSSSIPEWAKQVPEDIWKEKLMKGLKEPK